MTDFSEKIDKILEVFPQALAEEARKYLRLFLLKCAECGLEAPTDEVFLRQFVASCISSQFIAETLLNDPQAISAFLPPHHDKKIFRYEDYKIKLQDLLKEISQESDLLRKLRLFRRCELFRIAWRDLNGHADLTQTLQELSALADAMIVSALDKLMAYQIEKWGQPLNFQGQPQQLIILAVGKLGSNELNFSSDIDLIFCFPGGGYTLGKPTRLSSEEFFLKLGQSLINALHRVTADGFCFRVDMRLRPYGGSGPLVASLGAMASYYQQQGREWERFALAKARLIHGGAEGAELMTIIKQFVYRRYVDYGVIASLRQIKSLIRKESQSSQEDIKRGEGGIREVEFIAQVFQLIRGGKEPWLQETHILKILALLAQTQCLPGKAVTELTAAYKFLRMTEHRLQQYNDQQTHRLPVNSIDKLRLALSLGFSDWESFYAELDKHRQQVKKHFERMIAEPEPAHTKTRIKLDPRLEQLLTGQTDVEEVNDILKKLGFREVNDIPLILSAFQGSFNFRRMDEGARKRLYPLLQQILPVIAETAAADLALKRVLAILEAILRRSVYLSLLLENPGAQIRLVELCAASPWITDLIARFPFLLDELLDSKTLYMPFSAEKIHDQLRQYILNLPEDDLEQHMDCLRRFKQAQILRVAASDVMGTLPLMKVSDHLTHTASVIIGYAKRLAWRYLAAKHGIPLQNREPLQENDFAIIAYGKLGGIELGYASDLDLVFLHDIQELSAYTDGEKPITNAEFFLRLAQRIIHILTIQTPAGLLYRVDTRLRPSGQSGLIVSSFTGYAHYQQSEAWIWEHQALARARVISGSEKFIKKFNQLRETILSQKRDTQKLAQTVVEMREKMREAAKKPPPHFFDVDQGLGGIKDIEFIAQFAVLNWAWQYPQVHEYTDNIRILEALASCDILSRHEAEKLCEAYLAYRQIVHRNSLQNQPPWTPDDELIPQRDFVRQIWRTLLGH